MSKHSPGPWVVRDTHSAGRSVRSSQGLVCSMAWWQFDRLGVMDESISQANARLIAASPIGFELAREILRACDHSTGREISAVTRKEIEPLRKLAEEFMKTATQS